MPGVIDRLEARGLLRRGMSALDARVRLITLIEKGACCSKRDAFGDARSARHACKPLSEIRRGEFMRDAGNWWHEQRFMSRHRRCGCSGH